MRRAAAIALVLAACRDAPPAGARAADAAATATAPGPPDAATAPPPVDAADTMPTTLPTGPAEPGACAAYRQAVGPILDELEAERARMALAFDDDDAGALDALVTAIDERARRLAAITPADPVLADLHRDLRHEVDALRAAIGAVATALRAADEAALDRAIDAAREATTGLRAVVAGISLACSG
jgi:hypothetical protein